MGAPSKDRASSPEGWEPSGDQLSALLERWRLSRRQLLQLAAAAAAATAASRAPVNLLGGAFRASEVSPALADASSPDFSVSVLRARDLLNLRFDFYNLQLKTDLPLGPRLERKDHTNDAVIVITFPPQNIAERAFFEAQSPGDGCPDPVTGDETDCLSLAVDSRMAGPSRLAFRVPDDITHIPYTLDGPAGLLAWERLEPRLVPAALPRPAIECVKIPPIIIASDLPAALAEPGPGPTPPPEEPIIRVPEDDETAIEFPWHLILSPSNLGGWAHSRLPVTRDGRTELWHTRLARKRTVGDVTIIDEEDECQRILRAVWALPTFDRAEEPPEDFDPPVPFLMSLDQRDRWEFVRLTSDFFIADFTPSPLEVDRFMLSSLGAWANIRGAWEPPPILSREEWRHRATMGRDHYVRVVMKGYLFPFGHRASLITITERKFQPVATGLLQGHRAAFLRQRKFIVVRKPEMAYPAPGQRFDGREMPFRRVRITTLVTPNLDLASLSDILGLGEAAFWPQVNGKPFLFHLVAEDGDGQVTEFSAPLAFISNDYAHPDTFGEALALGYIIFYYGDDADESKRTREIHGQKIAFAPSSPGKRGDTTLETSQIKLGADAPEPDVSLPPDQPHFFPTIGQATVRLPAAEQAKGGALAPAVIEYHDAYLTNGFDNPHNKGAVFARMVNPVSLGFTEDTSKSGGSITPNMNIVGLSRALGSVGGSPADPTAGLDALLAGEFDPARFFADAEAKILGAIDLFDVVKAVLNILDPGELDKALKITTRRIPEGAEVPEAIETTMTWNATTQHDPAMFFEPVPDPQDNGLTLTARFTAKLADPTDPDFEIVGELKSFKVNLLGTGSLNFISIQFNKLVFTSRKGQKPDVDVDIAGVEFAGMLELINELQQYLQSGSGFSGIDIILPPEPDAGIRAGYSVGLPSIAVGVFSLQNISLSAGLNIPFLGDPARVRFAFCERENPFLLSVFVFGGGGFFGIALGLDGVELLEASFEFGGNFTFDIVVASGGIYAMAGVYFKMEGDEAQLTGYLRMGGELDVLGIVAISIELYLGLTYAIDADEVWGQATLTIEVEILFFSFGFETTVERKFSGSTHSLTFIDMVPPNDPNDFTQGSDAWDAYAEAFASIPA